MIQRISAFRFQTFGVPVTGPRVRLCRPSSDPKKPAWLGDFTAKVDQLKRKVVDTDVQVARGILKDMEKLRDWAVKIEPNGKVARKLGAIYRLSTQLAKRHGLEKREAAALKIEQMAPQFVPDRELPYRRHLLEARKVLVHAEDVLARAERGDSWGHLFQRVEAEIDPLLHTWPHLE